MGGQALKIAKTRRYSASEYETIKFMVSSILMEPYLFSFYFPLSYRKKESHGDLDVLIHSGHLNKLNIDLREYIQERFSPTEIVKNGSVYSFDYKEFQIDFIVVKTKDWETSKIYYSYNDLGNLMGRIAYNMGLRYGHFGLAYKHLHKGRTTGLIEISRDPQKIFHFLGFYFSEYQKGFDTLEDIFDYVIGSYHFNKKIFAYESLNHQNRTRNKKRKTYQQFLEYLDTVDFDGDEFNNDKKAYISMAERYFGIELFSQIEEFEKKIKLKEELSKKFNGNILMQKFPQLKGKTLGNAISNFRKEIELIEDFDDYLYKNDQEIIINNFKKINNL
ncbi:MAG: hypothetical protein ACOCVF_04250 [bacterium]